MACENQAAHEARLTWHEKCLADLEGSNVVFKSKESIQGGKLVIWAEGMLMVRRDSMKSLMKLIQILNL